MTLTACRRRTRTPDTRIMIPVKRFRLFAAVRGIPLCQAVCGLRARRPFRSLSGSFLDPTLTRA
jgi:hypothetical protein